MHCGRESSLKAALLGSRYPFLHAQLWTIKNFATVNNAVDCGPRLFAPTTLDANDAIVIILGLYKQLCNKYTTDQTD